MRDLIHRHNVTIAALLFAAFAGTVVAANWVTTEYGVVSIGFGLTATAGTYFAGLAFVLRDSLQDTGGRVAVVAAILTGAALSFLLAETWFKADPAFLPPGVTATSIAAGSAIAFLLSELADFTVYTPLRNRGYLRAAVASNVVGALVDTAVFLYVAGFAMRDVFVGQVVGKLTITLAVVVAVAVVRGWKTARAND